MISCVNFIPFSISIDILLLLMINNQSKCSKFNRFSKLDKLDKPNKIYRISAEDLRNFMSDDRDNVHSPIIKRENVSILDKLIKSDTKTYTINDILKEERSKDPIIDKVLSLIIDYNANYGNISEIEILRLVWERINSPINSEKKEVMCENLLHQLKDTIQSMEISGEISGELELECINGRIPRYLQSLQFNDAEDIINYVPMYVIKDEIVDKIINMKDKTKTKNYKYLTEYLDYYFGRMYIDTGLLTKRELDSITQDYYNEIIISHTLE